MKGLLSSGKLLVLVNDEEHVLSLKPRHVMAIQQHFKDKDPVDMEQTIFTAWYVLHDRGVFPGDLDEFMQAFDDIGPVEDDDPKA